MKKLFQILGVLFTLFFLLPNQTQAITVTGSWTAEDIITQKGSLSLTLPVHGGELNGTFSGAGGNLYQYGGRFTGNFSGGWDGRMSGSFSGWVSYQMPNPATGQNELRSDNIQGTWSGYLRPDGTGSANFTNNAKYGLAGGVSLHYSTEQFEKEYGKAPKSEGETAEPETSSESPEPSTAPSPSPTPTPTPEPRLIKLTDLNGKKINDGKVRIKTIDGKFIDTEVVNGQLKFDKSQVKTITIQTEDGKRISLSGEALNQEKIVMGDWQQWQEDIKTKLQNLANILNGGEEVNLDEHFNINWEGDDNFFQPPTFDFFRNFGAKDKISFYPGYITVNGDMNTPAHEALGHALTEVIGEGNKMKYAGGPHDDPWQPTYNKRSNLNPLSWFGDKVTPVSEERARGFAMSEGWAQFVGDKWQRELTDTSDSQSAYTLENAEDKLAQSKQGAYGAMYADEPGYGAKVENVVATAFNELYKGQSLEDTVKDFQAVREAYKQNNDGKSFQNINEYLQQKMSLTTNEQEKEKISQLIERLEL